MSELSPQEVAALMAEIEGFLSYRPAIEKVFIERLRPLIRQEIRRRFPGLWRYSEDLQQDAFVRLCELRKEDAARIRPPLAQLVTYIVDTPARMMLKTRKRFGTPVELQEWDGRRAPDQQDRAYLQELWRLLPRLSFKHARTLQIHAAHEVGDGPALHEALGITKDAAKRRILEAQDALLTLTRSEADHG